MKTISLLITFFLLCSFSVAISFYDQQFTTIEEASISMSSYQGKKVMIIVLPVIQTDDASAYLKSIDSLCTKYKASISMIGIPSIQDGYIADSLESLKIWYRHNLSNLFVIAKAMYIKKGSPQQNSLFKWLTDKNENQHFNEDAEGPGQKFFIDGQGELYGVFSSQKKLSEALISRMLQ